MPAVYTNFAHGTITNNPLSGSGTSLSSAELVDLPPIVAPDFAWIVLDPLGTAGEPEIVKVTAHANVSATATIVRAQQTSQNAGPARVHAVGTEWRCAWTALDGNAKLDKAGGTLTGDLYGTNVYASVGMSTPFINVSLDPVAAQDATRKSWVESHFVSVDGDVINGTLNLNGVLVIDPPASDNTLILRGANPTMYWQNEAGTANLGKIVVDDANDVMSVDCYIGAIAFRANDIERARFLSAVLLLGKTSSNLDNEGVEIHTTGSSVLGSIRSTINDDAFQNVYLRHMGTADANDEMFVQFTRSSSGTTIGSITQNASSGVKYNTTSDYRLKNVVGPIDDALERIMLLQPKRVTWIDDPGTEVDAFLAHEVTPAVPEAVTGDKDAVAPAPPLDEQGQADPAAPAEGSIIPQQLDNSKLVPLLVATVQNLAQRVADLESRSGPKPEVAPAEA